MFKSKSPQTDPADVPVRPSGDAAAAGRLTGHPTATSSTATSSPGGAATAVAEPVKPSSTGAPSRPSSTTKPEPTAPHSHGPSVVKRTTSNVKRVLLVVIGALAALFAVFNSQQVQVHWIFGDAVQSPLIVVILIAFVAGALIGWIGAKLGGRSGTTGN